MHGYVSEWCLDSWHPSYEGAPADGSARLEKDAKAHVIRGGAFNSPAERCRSAAREKRDEDYRKDDLGFRCVRAKVKRSFSGGSQNRPDPRGSANRR